LPGAAFNNPLKTNVLTIFHVNAAEFQRIMNFARDDAPLLWSRIAPQLIGSSALSALLHYFSVLIR
jgi:hypothetical protein